MNARARALAPGGDMPAASAEAAAWDARVTAALARAPAALARRVAWLREPSRRLVRTAAGVLLVLGGLLAILPLFGLWMLPLGLALLAEDILPLKARLERGARWIERRLGRGR